MQPALPLSCQTCVATVKATVNVGILIPSLNTRMTFRLLWTIHAVNLQKPNKMSCIEGASLSCRY